MREDMRILTFNTKDVQGVDRNFAIDTKSVVKGHQSHQSNLFVNVGSSTNAGCYSNMVSSLHTRSTHICKRSTAKIQFT